MPRFKWLAPSAREQVGSDQFGDEYEENVSSLGFGTSKGRYLLVLNLVLAERSKDKSYITVVLSLTRFRASGDLLGNYGDYAKVFTILHR